MTARSLIAANQAWLRPVLEGFKDGDNWSTYSRDLTLELRAQLSKLLMELRRMGYYGLQVDGEGKITMMQMVNSRITKNPVTLDLCDQCDFFCKIKVDGVFRLDKDGNPPRKCWER